MKTRQSFIQKLDITHLSAFVRFKSLRGFAVADDDTVNHFYGNSGINKRQASTRQQSLGGVLCHLR